MANEVTSTYSWGNETLAQSIGQNMKTNGQDERVAKRISTELDNIENQLLDELSKPEKDSKGNQVRDSGKIEELQVRYRRALRLYEVMQELMRNGHEILMRAIQSLRV